MQMFDVYKTSGYLRHFCEHLGLISIKNEVPVKSGSIICTKVVNSCMVFPAGGVFSKYPLELKKSAAFAGNLRFVWR